MRTTLFFLGVFCIPFQGQSQQTQNFITKFNASLTVVNSIAYDNGSAIGIGTATPSGKLNIVHSSGLENVRITNNPEATLVSENNGSKPAMTLKRISGQTGTLNFLFTSNPTTNLTVGSGSSIFRNSVANTDMVFLPSVGDATSGFMILRRNGKLLIGSGTTHNVQSSDLSARLNVRTDNVGSGTATMGIESYVTSDQDWNTYNLNLIVNRRAIKAIGVQGVDPANNNAPYEMFSVLGDGTTTIGAKSYVNTTYGTPLLSVYGLIAAKEIIVDVQQTSWADFVFDKTYKLPPLEDVKKYIESNKHLPGVKSEQQLKTEGLSVNDMLKVQMQKIEELTLYVIGLNEQVKKLQQENEQLKNQK